jgi:hypothetical protein
LALLFCSRMADELPRLWEKFNLTETEDVELEIPGGKFQKVVSRGKTCIIGKLIADRLVSKELLKDSLSRWWKIKGEPSFKVLGDNLFLIDFTYKEDKERVLARQSWVFENSLFLIEDFDGTAAPTEFTFDKASFWVQMTNLPLGCMGKEIGEMIAASVGVVQAIDTDGEGLGWGESLRAKILLDLSKPLPRGRKIKLQGSTRWITFKYEHLPKFCFNCGVIVHGKSGCTRQSSLRLQEQEYGPWLRAPSPTRLTDRNQGRFNTRRGASSQGNSEKGAQREKGHKRRDDRNMVESDGEKEDGAAADTSQKERNPKPRRKQGGEGGTNYGNSNSKSNIYEGERMRRDIGVQEKEKGNTRHDEFMRKDMRPSTADQRENKKGKWEADLRSSAPNTQGHVAENEVNETVDQLSMGPDGIVKSPMSSQSFKGPRISEVEKTMQAEQSGSKKETGGVKNTFEQTMVTWKRKTRGDDDAEDTISLSKGGKKKRDAHEDIKTTGAVRKGQITCEEKESKIGSGLAEAVVQPRRPQ